MNIKEELGLIHFYYGSGKGKTSAAIGVIIRALAYDLKIVYVQFLKNGMSSENIMLDKYSNVNIMYVNKMDKFTFDMNETELAEIKHLHNENLKKAIDLCETDQCDILILDEIGDALDLKLIDEKLIFDFLECKPSKVEVILTGHKGIEKIIDLADYVSEINNIKHPFDKGIQARKGIDK